MIYLDRHLEERLRRFAKSFEVVLLAGARQVGKSTLLQHVFPGVKSVVFDPVQDIYGARRDPDQFLDTFGSPLILDDVQYAPELLPPLKRRVDRLPGKGQYLLTGSQNLSVMRNVSESLAGRVGILRLDGLTPAELAGRAGEPCWLEAYLDNPETFVGAVNRRPVVETGMSLPHYLWRGQMPRADRLRRSGHTILLELLCPDICRARHPADGQPGRPVGGAQCGNPVERRLT